MRMVFLINLPDYHAVIVSSHTLVPIEGARSNLIFS
uniref:Uncharacterized protein n=1 Tax=Anguilla anguilla TaxID=7936 RepID=A0A0E9WD02_ANGAN